MVFAPPAVVILRVVSDWDKVLAPFIDPNTVASVRENPPLQDQMLFVLSTSAQTMEPDKVSEPAASPLIMMPDEKASFVTVVVTDRW